MLAYNFYVRILMRAAQFLCIWVLAQWTTMDWQWRWGTDCRRDGFAAYTRASLPAAAVDVQTDGLYVRRSVCPVHCGKTADRIIGRTGPGMRQVVRFGDRSTGRGTFWGEFGARHCNQWGLYGVRVRQCRDAALFPNYFGQACYITRCIAEMCEAIKQVGLFVGEIPY